MPLTPEDVQNKRFTVVRFKSGYDEEEVDSFLDEIEAELRRLNGENASLKQSASAGPAAPAPAAAPAAPRASEDPNETALRTLLLAQRTADDAIAQAQAEAEAILTEARGRAAVLEAEAQSTHRERVGALERERAELEAELGALRTFERDFRTRLRAYLQTQLGELDARGSVEPAPPARTAPSAPPASAASAPPASATPAPAPAATSAAPDASAAPAAASPLAAAAAAAAAVGGSGADDEPGAEDQPVSSIPGLAPAAAPLRPADPAATPFSSAPTPGSAPFASRPAGGVPGAGIDTDVDAASDAPSGPPTEAADDPVEDEE